MDADEIQTQRSQRSQSSQRTVIAIVIWLIAIVLAAMFDRTVALWMRDSGAAGFMRANKWLAETIKIPGEFYFTILVAIAIAIFHPLKWRAGGFVVLATVVSGINGLTKWISGRTRPFRLPPEDLAQPFALEPFRGGISGLFVSKNLCFPSGHAALAFATASAVAMLFPRSRWRWIGYVLATLVAIERVAENAHWLSDSVAGAAIGIAGVHVIAWIVRKMELDKTPPAS